jgi:hypothetical protein
MATDMWISDHTGHIGLFDVDTGALVPKTYHLVHPFAEGGLHLTDIAFIGDTMYGTTSNTLWAIDQVNGDTASVGNNYPVKGMNALVGHGDELQGAAADEIYNINGITAKVTDYKAIGYASAGTLAWDGKTLYESVILGNADALFNVTKDYVVNDFRTPSGGYLNDVFGLASSGSAMYAVAGHDIYSVNPHTAELTYLSSDAASGMGPASGAAFVNENMHG